MTEDLVNAVGTQGDAPVPVVITAYSDKTFTYVSYPPISVLLGMKCMDTTCCGILAESADTGRHLYSQVGVLISGIVVLQALDHCKGILQVTKTPPTTYFLKKAAGIESGSQRPGHQSVATISAKYVYEIAKVKQQDSKDVPLESMCRNIAGTCRSMGIKVVGRLEAPAS